MLTKLGSNKQTSWQRLVRLSVPFEVFRQLVVVEHQKIISGSFHLSGFIKIMLRLRGNFSYSGVVSVLQPKQPRLQYDIIACYEFDAEALKELLGQVLHRKEQGGLAAERFARHRVDV